MEANDSSRGLLTRLAGYALVAGLLLATTSVAQNRVPAPPIQTNPPRQQGDQPGKEEKLPPPKRASDKKEAEEKSATGPETKVLPAPALEKGEEGMAINLPTALKLANARAWDIMIAQDQLRIALAELEGARVLWLPTLQIGTDYQYHSGIIQTVPGQTITQDRSGLYNGMAPLALFYLTDAIFAPLAQRQVVRAENANIQTARNDTLTDMAQVYFNLLEAEADLASIVDVNERAVQMVTKAEGLLPGGLIPAVEVARVRAAKANFEQVVETARQRWRDASAEVVRVTRLKPTVVLQPLEPPQVRLTLIPLPPHPDDLIPIALANRPELTFEEAQAEAAYQRLRQEKWRPLLPILIGRGGGTVPPDALAFGSYGAGPNSDLHFGLRSDWDVGAYWEVRNLGFGNHALIRQRRAEYELARHQEYRFRDLVAAEVTQAWVDVRSAQQRMQEVEGELRQAEQSARQNLEGMTEIKRPAGGINILIIRPQEVVQSLQALEAAYFDYYGVVADYNRAQFRLYRAIGSPAQALACHQSLGGPKPPSPHGAPRSWTLSLEASESYSSDKSAPEKKPEAPAKGQGQ